MLFLNKNQGQVQKSKTSSNSKINYKLETRLVFSRSFQSQRKLKKNKGQEQVQEKLFSLRSKVNLLCRRFLLRRNDKIKDKFKNQRQVQTQKFGTQI